MHGAWLISGFMCLCNDDNDRPHVIIDVENMTEKQRTIEIKSKQSRPLNAISESGNLESTRTPILRKRKLLLFNLDARDRFLCRGKVLAKKLRTYAQVISHTSHEIRVDESSWRKPEQGGQRRSVFAMVSTLRIAKVLFL